MVVPGRPRKTPGRRAVRMKRPKKTGGSGTPQSGTRGRGRKRYPGQ